MADTPDETSVHASGLNEWGGRLNHFNSIPLGPVGLYDPSHERDACGVSLVCSIKGKATRKILDDAFNSVVCMSHRGAEGAEKNSGDGAGIMTGVPHQLFSQSTSFPLPAAGEYGCGVFFLNPNDANILEQHKRAFEELAGAIGLQVLGWREVGRDNSELGLTALKFEPAMLLGFVSSKTPLPDQPSLDRKLYQLRKLAQNNISYDEGFYICSLSSRTLVWKGMLTPAQLFPYFNDLRDPRYETPFAIVHTRFSTNTFPSWDRAQPMRFLAHNGEINTLQGNVNCMNSREGNYASKFYEEDDLSNMFPIIDVNSSDSGKLDNSVELMVINGRKLPEAMMMCIPEPWENDSNMHPEKRAYYEYNSMLMEPWDGPGLFCFSDGECIGAVLDRNGLRPARYSITTDDELIMGSETGTCVVPNEKILHKGRLQPGKMLLVNMKEGRLIKDEEIKLSAAAQSPYAEWLSNRKIHIDDLTNAVKDPLPEVNPVMGFDPRLPALGYTLELIYKILIPMVLNGKEDLGSMGNDAPFAFLSDYPKPIYEYFKQTFAQVTNPPIDPIREAVVMSTRVAIGPQGNLLIPTDDACNRLVVDNPVLTLEQLHAIRRIHTIHADWTVVDIDITFPSADGPSGLKKALDRICDEVETEIARGAKLVILTDRKFCRERASIPGLLAIGSVHQHLIRMKKRQTVGLILESAEVREVHHVCTLVGYGADAIVPWMAFETMLRYSREGVITTKPELKEIQYKMLKAYQYGLRKVMAKMGISTLNSYRYAQIFEAIGVGKDVMSFAFTGTQSRISGVGWDVFGAELLKMHQRGYPPRDTGAKFSIPDYGEYHFRTGGERHINDPIAIGHLQDAVRNKNPSAYKAFSEKSQEQVNKCAIRALFDLQFAEVPIPLDEVELASNIVKRFCTGAMSYGSISEEAHTTLAIAMNRIGGKSNTGEGGEDPARWTPEENGDSKKSAIKQIASGRFGVTISYLTNAIELQIKMAQGAKPGEGGELPGYKVVGKIASTRRSTAGVGLISPPPHHDIYSIEDLAQLIHDLKCANPAARVSVKLVSKEGVGVIASGVAKGHADHILISGHDGGTGASSWTGIKHAGLPWEFGLAETHQCLVMNNLRGRVVVQVDGQFRTGRDVVFGSLLGADEFGFATVPLIAMGCTMMRKCHLNTCPVGIATQDPDLRAKFAGAPEHVINYLFYLAEEVRELMAKLGFRNMDDMQGRADRIIPRKDGLMPKQMGCDIKALITPASKLRKGVPTKPCEKQDHSLESRLDNKLIKQCKRALENKEPVVVQHAVCNTDRVLCTTLSHEMAKIHGEDGLPEDTITVKFRGTAGQSLGAFLGTGITIELCGESNDYVGKGLSGGKIIVYPDQYHPSFVPENEIIVGNVCFYGATGGKAFMRGQAAERFCVRNSGAETVIEGVGDHGCEYMTGGRTVILGPVGKNFGSGMTGGVAYIYDPEKKFPSLCNPETIDLDLVETDEDIAYLKGMLEQHKKLTGSGVAGRMLDSWPAVLSEFVKVFPKDYKKALADLAKSLEAPKPSAKGAKSLKGENGASKSGDIEDVGEDTVEKLRKLNKVTGFKNYARKADPYRDVKERINDFKEINVRHDLLGIRTQAARCMDCGVPFCQSTHTGCPLGNIIPRWNELVFQERWETALSQLLKTNNFPEFTGRVCPAPCEGACVLGIIEDPVSIKSVEAKIIDYAWEHGLMVPKPPSTRTGKHIAIIGGGPAGMAAADQLNKAGHTVTVYERAPKMGGLLTFGIPNMKLQKSVVARRFKLLQDEGITFVNNCEVGKDLDANVLIAQNDAVLCTVGATVPRKLPIPGCNAKGIYLAMEYLGRQPEWMDKIVDSVAGQDVVVIGGGDTGNDCIGTSLRLKCKSVTAFEILPEPPATRAVDNPWPTWPKVYRIDYGHSEVRARDGKEPREYCTTSREFTMDENGHVSGISTIQVEWTRNEKGQFNMKEIPGSERFFPCQAVFLAMGFLGPEKTLPENLMLDLDVRSNFKTVAEGKYLTSVDKVYAAGDCRRGQSLVVWAISEGRQAAREIDIDLMGDTELGVQGGVTQRLVQ